MAVGQKRAPKKPRFGKFGQLDSIKSVVPKGWGWHLFDPLRHMRGDLKKNTETEISGPCFVAINGLPLPWPRYHLAHEVLGRAKGNRWFFCGEWSWCNMKWMLFL